MVYSLSLNQPNNFIEPIPNLHDGIQVENRGGKPDWTHCLKLDFKPSENLIGLIPKLHYGIQVENMCREPDWKYGLELGLSRLKTLA